MLELATAVPELEDSANAAPLLAKRNRKRINAHVINADVNGFGIGVGAIGHCYG